MKMIMKFKLDNTVFEEDIKMEIVSVLKSVIEKIEDHDIESIKQHMSFNIKVRDTNGNRIGRAVIIGD